MYGKIFEQIYNSTVCQDWKTLIVFQQCIILSDDLGILDMTPEAISRRTGIPLEIIAHGIKELEKPDPRSRSTKSEGRRLELIDSHRDWGWVVVNKVEYRKLASRLEKQENDKVRIANKRAITSVSQPVANCSDQSQEVADVAHTDTDTNTDLKSLEQEFSEFWKAYPRKIGKTKCLKLWKSLKPPLQTVLETITKFKGSSQWGDPKYIPHPSTWLGQGRWEDEITLERDPRDL